MKDPLEKETLNHILRERLLAKVGGPTIDWAAVGRSIAIEASERATEDMRQSFRFDVEPAPTEESDWPSLRVASPNPFLTRSGTR